MNVILKLEKLQELRIPELANTHGEKQDFFKIDFVSDFNNKNVFFNENILLFYFKYFNENKEDLKLNEEELFELLTSSPP